MKRRDLRDEIKKLEHGSGMTHAGFIALREMMVHVFAPLLVYFRNPVPQLSTLIGGLWCTAFGDGCQRHAPQLRATAEVDNSLHPQHSLFRWS